MILYLYIFASMYWGWEQSLFVLYMAVVECFVEAFLVLERWG